MQLPLNGKHRGLSDKEHCKKTMTWIQKVGCSTHQSTNFFFFFFGHPWSIWKLLGQRSNPSHSWVRRHSCSNAGPLTYYTKLGIEPVPPQRPCQIIKPLRHRGNSWPNPFNSWKIKVREGLTHIKRNLRNMTSTECWLEQIKIFGGHTEKLINFKHDIKA